MARDKFAEDFLNPRTLTLVVLLLYVPFVGQAYWVNPYFLTHPLFYVVLLGPVALYALEYWRYTKNAMNPENGWGVSGPPVTFAWDEQGYEASSDGNGSKVGWSNFSHVVETEHFIKLYVDERKPGAYVFKRPMSEAQLADFRSCAAVVGRISPVFA